MNKFLEKHFPTFRNYKINKQERGVVFITVLFVGLLLTFLGLSFANVALVQLKRSNDNVYVSNALLAAEAGIEQTLHTLNGNNSFEGYSETDFYDNDQQGRGTYQTTITNGTGPNERIISSIGRAYHPNSDRLIKERRVRVTIVGTSSSGNSVYAGAGGLNLTGGTSITGTSVYVNGTINISGGSRIGSETNPIPVNVAHNSCPPGATPGASYPLQCSSGQPITFDTGSYIFGPTCATNQVDYRVATWQNPWALRNLIPNCTADPEDMPSYNRAGHIAATAATGTYTSGSPYHCPYGSRTWPANLRLNGNVSIGSGCTIVLTGNVYVSGNLTLGGGMTFVIDDSLGTTRPVILVDGNVSISGGAKVQLNSSSTSIHFVTYKGHNSCNLALTCSGNDLKTSSGQTYIDVQGGGNFPGAIFQAPWGRIVLTGGGTTGSAIAQTINMSGGGTLVFGTALSSGTSIWTVRSYQYDYE